MTSNKTGDKTFPLVDRKIPNQQVPNVYPDEYVLVRPSLQRKLQSDHFGNVPSSASISRPSVGVAETGLDGKLPSAVPGYAGAALCVTQDGPEDRKVATDQSTGISVLNNMNGDVKLQKNPASAMISRHMVALRRTMSRTSKGGRRGKFPHFSAWVTQQLVNTSSSTSAQAPVNTLNLGTSGSVVEMSSFTTLFDMARCTDIKIQCYVLVPGSNTSPIEVGVCFDPANAGAYGSANATQLATQHRYWVIPSSTDAVSAQTRTGLQELHIKIPKSPQTISAPGTSLVGGGWFAPTDSNAFVGFIKSYIDASTASTTIQTLNVFYRVEFMSRS